MVISEGERPTETGRPVVRGTRYQPLVPILAVFCLGIAVDRWLAIGRFGHTAEAIGLSSGLLLLAWWWFWKRGRSVVSQWFLLAAVAALGGTWHHAWWHLFSPSDVGLYADAVPRPVVIRGTALGPPRRLPAPPASPLRSYQLGDRSRLRVRVTAIRDGRRWRKAAGWTTVVVDGHLLGIRGGDRLRIVGQLSRPMPAGNPGDFDFADFARGQRRLSFVRASHPDCVTRLARSSAGGIARCAAQVRAWGSHLLWRHLRRPQSGLAAAVLLGAREQLNNDRTEPFVTTGTIHLLVISGLHVGILAGMFLFTMRIGLLPRRTALVFVALLVIGYACLTEVRPPVVRAAVLVVVMSMAGLMGRQALAFNSLAAAALVVLAMNPHDLFRTGSQLSFLAVAALAWLGGRVGWRLPWDGPRSSDPLDQLIARTRPWLQRAARRVLALFGDLLLATLVVWLVVTPLVMARFHLLTPVTLLLGPILWLPLAVSLLAGFAVLGCGLLVPPLCGPFAAICNGGLATIEGWVTWADRLPGSHYWVSGPSDWWLAGLYGGLAAAVAMPRLLPSWHRSAVALTAWIVVGVAAAQVADHRQSNFQCDVLSVGHGCAVVLQLPNGKTVLYDAGCLGSPLSAARSIAGYLWSRGITRLDGVVLSHADLDHYNGLPELLRRFPVAVVLVSPTMFRERAPGLLALRQSLAEHGVPVVQVAVGSRLPFGRQVRLRILHPPPHGVPGSDNANSIVLAAEYAGRRFLLTGDIESPGLDRLLASPAVDCDVLLAPHHGSRHSNPRAMTRWCHPEWVVISGGRWDRAEGVERTFRRAGAEVLHTARFGAVRFQVSLRGELETTVTRLPRG